MNIKTFKQVIMRIATAALVLNAASILVVHAAEKTVGEDAVKVGDGSQFLRDLYNYIATLSDYSCRIDVRTYKPQKTVDTDCKFFYKKLNQVRIEAIGGGYRNGSVVVKFQDGTVAGRGGMLLGEMKLNLDTDSRMLILPNGLNCTKCDYLELLEVVKEKLGEGYTCTLATAPGAGSTANILEIDAPTASGGNPYAKITVSNIDRVPSRWELYDSGKLFSIAEFKNIKINAGLSPNLFHI
jgi:outer membrane lipoprotein-sorting protein